MKRETDIWTVELLKQSFTRISFPEYQREPNIWSRIEKQRLIDSMLRQFDIASLYLYVSDDVSIECIDGRQRIGAIMSFLGQNPQDPDNGFTLKIMNEIYTDDEDEHPFSSLEGSSFQQIRAMQDRVADRMITEFKDYKITVVKLAESSRAEEFNLQFTRLNLGTIINSGEKLHAMVGDLRDACFADDGLGSHPFLKSTKIPTRRYAMQQTAAQIIAQVFSVRGTKQFTRTRHFDLQRLFKEHVALPQMHRGWIDDTRATMDDLEDIFESLHVLRNRAVTVSTVLLACTVRESDDEWRSNVARFVREFTCRLRWQISKGLHVDPEYEYLIDFQRHLTQASVEKPAVTARAQLLEHEYWNWVNSETLTGDDSYLERTGCDPSEACRDV